MNIELLKKVNHEVLPLPSNFLLKSGMTLLFSLTFIIVLMSFIIRSPDILKGDVIITSEKLPVSVISKNNGKIAQLFVKEEDHVAENQILAVIESSNSHNEIFRFNSKHAIFFDSLINHSTVITANFNKNIVFGDLQGEYNTLLNAYQSYFFHIKNNSLEKNLAQLNQQIEINKSLLKRKQIQHQISKKQYEIVNKDHLLDMELQEMGAISKAEINKSLQLVLQEQYKIEGIEIEIVKIESSINDIYYQITMEQSKHFEDSIFLLEELKRVSTSFLSKIDTWDKNFVLRSPVEGKVSFYKFWSENQYLKTGDEVIVVLPSESEGLFIYAYVPIQGFGKVKVGQKVKIELEDFPANEFGILEGYIRLASKIARDNSYFVRIELTNDLITTYNIELPLHYEMKGELSIMVKSRRLIEKVFNFRFDIFNN